MKKAIKIVIILVLILIIFFVLLSYSGISFFGSNRPNTNVTTITELPEFPGFPLFAFTYSKEKQDRFVSGIVDHKLTTYPENSSRAWRTAKFDATGIFNDIPATEEQIRKVAINYDNILLTAKSKDLLPIFRKYNPHIKVMLYIDAALTPKFAEWKVKSDIGSIDVEDTFWIVQNHPEWLLRDENGEPITTRGDGLPSPGAYWPDPGNKDWQNFAAEKINKLLNEIGGEWNAILIDDFVGTAHGYEKYANSSAQVNYSTDASYQNAQIEFFTNVRRKVGLPFIPNMDGISTVLSPEFFSRLAIAAGGIQNEVYPEKFPIEDFRIFLEEIKKIPQDVRIHINSKPSPEWAGDVDRTLFAYYSFLLFADRNREAYWTFKEGVSDVPHYWYNEFDLNFGNSLDESREINNLFVREFENAVVVVNSDNHNTHEFIREGTFFDVAGKPLILPITLEPRSALLVVKNPAGLVMK